MSVTSGVLTVERTEHVATVWLDSPERRNAMGSALWSDLPLIMNELSDDPTVRAVVIAAKGPHFTVGLDLKEMGSGLMGGAVSSKAEGALLLRAEVKRLQRSISSVAECPKPVIAAIHGWCIGGGVDLITACDIRLASADARFSVRESRMAIVADLGTLQRLPGILSRGHVAELAYTGKDITAARAKEIGLVNDVHPDVSALHAATIALAREIAANSPLAVQGTKAVLKAGEGRSVEEGLDYVAVWNAGFLQSNDLVEAMSSFMEKRPPTFSGT